MFRQNETEDRASASTVGIILLVAITIVLGATIGGYVLDFRSSVESGGPDASFQFEYNSITGNIEVTHETGDAVNGSQIRFAGAANEYTSFGSIPGWSGNDVSSGDGVSLSVDEGETLKLIWRSLDGDETEVLATYEVPDVGPAAQGNLSVTANPVTDEVEVTVDSLSEVSDAQAHLEVEASNGTSTRTVSSTGTITIDDVGDISQGETVTATLYESSSESNQLAQATDTTPSVTIESIELDVGGSENGTATVNVSAQNVDYDAVSVRIVDNATANGDAPDETGTISDLDDGAQSVTIDLENDKISTSEEVTVTIYETSAQNYELANETVTEDGS